MRQKNANMANYLILFENKNRLLQNKEKSKGKTENKIPYYLS